MEQYPIAITNLCLLKLPQRIQTTRGWTPALELQSMVKAQIQMRWLQIAMCLLVLRQQATWLLHLNHTITTTTSRDSPLSSQAAASTNPLTRSMAIIIPTTTITITNLKSTWQHRKSSTWPTIITSTQDRGTVLGSRHKRHPITPRKDLQGLETRWGVGFPVGLRHSNRALRIYRRCWNLHRISCTNRILNNIKIMHKKESKVGMLASWKSWASRTKEGMQLLIILW